MRIILIRHGEADYTRCVENGFFGLGINLAPLSELGCRQAEHVALNEKLKAAQIIVSSPYTRAMQTAAIISRITNIPLTVDVDIHEWLPDLSFMNSYEEEEALSADFLENEGMWPDGGSRRWESIDMLSKRALTSLKRYLHYDKVILVCHAVVMYHLSGLNAVPHCSIVEIDFTQNFKPSGWFFESK